MIVAEFSIVPMGAGASTSKQILAVHQVLKDSGLKFVPGPMSTSVEAKSFQQIFEVVTLANQKLTQMGALRIITTVMIDYRLDKEISIESKLKAIK